MEEESINHYIYSVISHGVQNFLLNSLISENKMVGIFQEALGNLFLLN